MAFCRPMRTALFFEELESRLLFSADLVGVDAEVLEQDYDEEPEVTADLETAAESEDGAASQAEEEGGAITAAPPEGDETEQATDEAGTKEEPDEPEAAGPVPDVAASGEGSADDSGTDKEKDKDSDSIAADDEASAPPIVAAPDTEVSYTPGDPPVALAPEAAVTDADSDNFFQGTLTVRISAGEGDGDELSIVEGGDVSLVNNNIKVEQKLVGSFAGGTGGTALVISWSPQATPDCAEAVLRQIAYGNDSDTAGMSSRTVDFVLTDGDGGTGATFQITINGEDDGGDPGQGEGDTGGGELPPGENGAPVLTLTGGPLDYVGGEEAILIAPAATVADGDSADFKQGTLTVSISQGGDGSDQLLIVEGGNVTILNNNIKVDQKLVGSFAGGTNGTALIISWTPQATPASAEAVLRQIAYGSGSAETPTGSRTVDFILTDGDGGTSNTVQAVINITADTGSAGDNPGQGEGGGEATPPVDTSVDEQVALPKEKSEPTASDGNRPEGGQGQHPPAGDGSEIPVSPAPTFETAAVFNAGVGTVGDFAPVSGESSAVPAPVGISQEQNGSPQEKSPDARESARSFSLDAGSRSGVTNVAPNPEDPAGLDKAGEGDGFMLPEQQAGDAAQGTGAGGVSQAGAIAAMKTTFGRLFDFFAPSTAVAAPAAPFNHDVSDGNTSAENEKVCREVEIMRQEMEEAFLQSTTEGRLMVYTTTGASLSLTAGIARYIFRSGSLLSGFLATIPLWKGFDPVAILSTPKIDRKNLSAVMPAEVETVDQKAETMFARGEA